MSITNKQLKELLNQYPDDAIIYIHDVNYDDNCNQVSAVDIKYTDSDDYKIPDIVLK